MITVTLLAGAVAGVAATRVLEPEYKVYASLRIATGTTRGEGEAPEPTPGEKLMNQSSWPELLTSFAILEKAIRRTALYVVPAARSDRPLFLGFDTDSEFRPGSYELRVADAGWQYTLVDGAGTVLQTGFPGDSIGRALGFRWRPPATALTPRRRAKFTLLSTRQAALTLQKRLAVTSAEGSNLVGVSMSGNDPVRITAVLSAVLDEFVAAAAELKQRNVTGVRNALERQIDLVERELKQGETNLESFRVQSVTMPVESPMDAGDPDAFQDPLRGSYAALQDEEANARRDRLVAERTLAAVRAGTLEPTALSMVPIVQSDAAAAELRAALAELSTRQGELRAAQRTYTDDHKTVRDLASAVMQLSSTTIPRLGMALVAELRHREQELGSRVNTTARQLRSIPLRHTAERRLRRSVESGGQLHDTLKKRYQRATLAERNTTPDVSILDPPVAPEKPSSDWALAIVVMAVTLSGAGAIAFALVRDRLDTRFRYPEQAIDELGLDVVGMVPAVQRAPAGRQEAEEAHLIEAFREIRLQLTHGGDRTGAVILTVTSPGPGDGKSFVSAHLAKSFAAAGYRTVLVDGDLRRGLLHASFVVAREPGLLEYLHGSATLDDVLRPAAPENLTVLPRGASDPRAVERLMSPRLPALVRDLGGRFEVIIADSPPLGAGIDALVLGRVTTNVLLVLRAGETDRRMADAKLKALARLPIHLLGAVLNGMRGEGWYEHQGHASWDASPDEAYVGST